MSTEFEVPRTGATPMPAQIRHVAEWARHANAYVDDHNAPPPDDTDTVPRDELVAMLEELGDLVQRYADSLRGFADRASCGECNTVRSDTTTTTGLGKLLQFPARPHPSLVPSRGAADPMANPHA